MSDVVLDGHFERAARQRAGLSDREAAKLAGRARPWLVNIETGRYRLPVKLDFRFRDGSRY
jgi:DNA-binding XRE family transcriptional regulator